MEQAWNSGENTEKHPDSANTRTKTSSVTLNELIRFINSQGENFAVTVQLGKEVESGDGKEPIHLRSGK